MKKSDLTFDNFSLPILTLSGPSGAGKDSLAQLLIQKTGFIKEVVSTTTRNPRQGEIDGVDYHFVTKEVFEAKINSGAFLEWEEVYNNLYYGTEKDSLFELQNKCNLVILVIDYSGALNLKKIFGNQLTTVFVKPPSIQALEDRLRARNTDTEQRIRERVIKASREIEFAPQFDATVVNDDIQACLSSILDIIQNILNKE